MLMGETRKRKICLLQGLKTSENSDYTGVDVRIILK